MKHRAKKHRAAALTRWAIRVATLAAVPALLSCQSDEKGEAAQWEYLHGNYAGAEQTLRKDAANTNENYVLNNDRLGSAAIAQYDLDTAESAFLRAYEVINSANVNDAGRQLSAVVVGEGTKVWKGEPFERAMTNYYLGLIYYIKGDYANARAAFENSLFKLRDYGEGDDKDKYAEFESDFTVAYLMLGKCWQHLNRPDLAANQFAKVASLRSDLAPAVEGLAHDQSNLFLVVDWGRGPKKVENVDHAFVGYGPTPEEAGPIPLPEVAVDDQLQRPLAAPYPTIDLLSLAQDRRWQDIDTIRAVKSVLGKGLMGVGAYETLHGAGFTGHRENSADIAAGLAMIAAGALIDASSQADLRQWEELPRSVFLIPLRVSPGTHDVTVLFPTGERQTWHGLQAPATGEATYYYRINLTNPPDRQWPPMSVAHGGSAQSGSAYPGNAPGENSAIEPNPPPVAETR